VRFLRRGDFCAVDSVNLLDNMKTWIDDLRSGLTRKAQADRIAGGKTYAGIGANLRRILESTANSQPEIKSTAPLHKLNQVYLHLPRRTLGAGAAYDNAALFLD
jgi:hypothetical protein